MDRRSPWSGYRQSPLAAVFNARPLRRWTDKPRLVRTSLQKAWGQKGRWKKASRRGVQTCHSDVVFWKEAAHSGKVVEVFNCRPGRPQGLQFSSHLVKGREWPTAPQLSVWGNIWLNNATAAHGAFSRALNDDCRSRLVWEWGGHWFSVRLTNSRVKEFKRRTATNQTVM